MIPQFIWINLLPNFCQDSDFRLPVLFRQKLSQSMPWVHPWCGRSHTLIGTHSKVMDLWHLTYDFCRSCRDEEEKESVLHLLGTCPAPSKKRKNVFDFLISNNLNDFDALLKTSQKNGPNKRFYMKLFNIKQNFI